MIHSKLLFVSVILNAVALIQRCGTLGWTHLKGMAFLIDIAVVTTAIAGLVNGVAFVLLAIPSIRRKLAKAVFAVFMVFGVIVEIVAIISFLVYIFVDEEIDTNLKQNATICAIMSGCSILVMLGVIPLFFFAPPPGLKSYRPEKYENAM